MELFSCITCIHPGASTRPSLPTFHQAVPNDRLFTLRCLCDMMMRTNSSPVAGRICGNQDVLLFCLMIGPQHAHAKAHTNTQASYINIYRYIHISLYIYLSLSLHRLLEAFSSAKTHTSHILSGISTWLDGKSSRRSSMSLTAFCPWT